MPEFCGWLGDGLVFGLCGSDLRGAELGGGDLLGEEVLPGLERGLLDGEDGLWERVGAEVPPVVA